MTVTSLWSSPAVVLPFWPPRAVGMGRDSRFPRSTFERGQWTSLRLVTNNLQILEMRLRQWYHPPSGIPSKTFAKKGYQSITELGHCNELASIISSLHPMLLHIDSMRNCWEFRWRFICQIMWNLVRGFHEEGICGMVSPKIHGFCLFVSHGSRVHHPPWFPKELIKC